MKTVLALAMMIVVCSCNNSKKEKQTTDSDTTIQNTTTSDGNTDTAPAAGSATISYSVNDTARSYSASILVSADKDKLSPGHDNAATVTANGTGESLIMYFVFAQKPGVYPVTGIALTKGEHVFGDVLSGTKK